MSETPINNRSPMGMCDPYCGCQYYDVLPEDRICMDKMSKEDYAELKERNKRIEELQEAV
jgi:hypothetical protein